MIENALIHSLKKLSRKEMTRFKDFSLSPYHNKHEDVKALVEYFSYKYPNFSAKNCQREFIWAKIFPNKKHNYPHLALVFTYSLRLLEHFFILEKLKKNGAQEQFLLAEFLREKQLFKYYEKPLESIKSQLENAEFRDADYYYNQYQLADEIDQKYLKVTQKREDDGLQRKQDALDLWFMAMKLRDACEMRMRNRFFGQEYQAGLLVEILEKIRSQKLHFQSVPAVYIYFLVHELLVNNAPKEYFLLKERIELEASFFPKSELQNIYNYLQNFCIQQINQGQVNFLDEIFQIYQSQLEKELIFEKNGKLAEWHYKNIVTAGLRSKHFEWTRAFIEKYKNRLLDDIAENAYSFNLANYFFATEKYQEVLPLLIQVGYSNMRYKLDARALLLKTYFVLEETEPFYALCDAFNQLLIRTKEITDFQKKGYQNMIKISRRIYQWTSTQDIQKRKDWLLEKEKIREELKNAKPLFNQAWLEEKWKSKI